MTIRQFLWELEKENEVEFLDIDCEMTLAHLGRSMLARDRVIQRHREELAASSTHLGSE